MFVGWCLESHIEQKLSSQLSNIFNNAASAIQRKRKALVKKIETKKNYFDERQYNAAMAIKGAIYVCVMFFF